MGQINKMLTEFNFTSTHNVTLVGVHIRRGNMLDELNTKAGFAVATKEYLENAVKFFISKHFKNVIFVVCTDDMEWSKVNMPHDVTVHFEENNSREVDLAVLSSCSHVITTVGTFGWWAGWLSGGLVTYYKWPAMPGSPKRKDYSNDYSDYFMQQWIGL